MKRTFVVMILSCAVSLPTLLSADANSTIDDIFKKMAKQLSRVEKKLPNRTVAVYGFEVIGKPDDTYGRYATEKLTHEIVSEGSFMVIERSRIDQVLKEQSLSLTGAVDSNTAARIGKILAVDAVIIGTILRSETGVEFIARVIQSEKGIILASTNERFTPEAPGDKTVVKKKDVPLKNAERYDAKNLKLSINKKAFSGSERIVVSYTGLPGNQNDWITLIEAAKPDTSYAQWFYTYGQTSGTHVFNPVRPGDYEVRVYFDWPRGGYIVRKRLRISVR